MSEVVPSGRGAPSLGGGGAITEDLAGGGASGAPRLRGAWLQPRPGPPVTCPRRPGLATLRWGERPEAEGQGPCRAVRGHRRSRRCEAAPSLEAAGLHPAQLCPARRGSPRPAASPRARGVCGARCLLIRGARQPCSQRTQSVFAWPGAPGALDSKTHVPRGRGCWSECGLSPEIRWVVC